MLSNLRISAITPEEAINIKKPSIQFSIKRDKEPKMMHTMVKVSISAGNFIPGFILKTTSDIMTCPIAVDNWVIMLV